MATEKERWSSRILLAVAAVCIATGLARSLAGGQGSAPIVTWLPFALAVVTGIAKTGTA